MSIYYDFEISMQGIKPRIWRRFLLKKTCTFADLHEAIQDAAPWSNSHLFQFKNGRQVIAGIPDDEEEVPDPDCRKVKLSSFFGKAKHCIYNYDFGDNWEAEVRLLGEFNKPGLRRRELLGGARSFPPDDSGGIPGYERYCQVVLKGKDPYGEDVKECLEWLGGWHPEKFEFEAAKKQFDTVINKTQWDEGM